MPGFYNLLMGADHLKTGEVLLALDGHDRCGFRKAMALPVLASSQGEVKVVVSAFNQRSAPCPSHAQCGGAQTACPNLHGLFGRKAGTGGGYESSDAMKKSGIVWDDTTIAEYSRDPKGKVPGTKMLYNGVKNAGQLADLVAYLKEATK